MGCYGPDATPNRYGLPPMIAADPKQGPGDRKPALDTIPSTAILEMGIRMGVGARKYGPFNWRTTGARSMTYVGAIRRHLAAFADGEWRDPECEAGTSHLAAIMACCAILIDSDAVGTLQDDRPPPAPTGEAIRYFQQHGRMPNAVTLDVLALSTEYVDLAGG